MDDVRYALRQLRAPAGIRDPRRGDAGHRHRLGGGDVRPDPGGAARAAALSPNPTGWCWSPPARTDGQPYERGASVGQWVAWRRARTIERAALYRWTFNFLVRGDGSRSLGGMVVTPDYFDVVGVRPIMGRALTAAEASRPGVDNGPGAPPTGILLGYDLWQREFGGDKDIVGRAVTLSRMPAPLPVIGVMPPGLRFLPDPGAAAEPNYDLNAKVDFWLAMTTDDSRVERGAGNAIARLKPGVDGGAGPARARGDVRRHRAGGSATRRPDRDRVTGAIGPQPRRRTAPRAAVRRGRPAVPDRLRQRQRPAPRARPPAAAGVRDARGDRRRPRPDLPARADRGGDRGDDGGRSSAPASPTRSSRA